MKLKPCDVSRPSTSGPIGDVFRAMIVFLALSGAKLELPPPPLLPAELPVLPVTVLLVMVTVPAVPKLLMPPPTLLAELPEMVLLMMVSVPALLTRPPPLFAELREMVLLAIVNVPRSEEHTSELQSRLHLVCRLLLEKKN